MTILTHLAAATAADALLRKAFLDILGILHAEVPEGSIPDSIMHLKVMHGGLGLQSAAEAAGRAYLGSWAAFGSAIARRCPLLAADIAAIFAPQPPAGPPPAPLQFAYQRTLKSLRSSLSNDTAQDLSDGTLNEPVLQLQRRLGVAAGTSTSHLARPARLCGHLAMWLCGWWP